MIARWFWAVLAALVVIAIGLIFWQTGFWTTIVPPVAQSPPLAPAAPTAAQAPASNAATATGENEPAAAPSAGTVAQAPSTNAAAPTAEKEPAPGAPTVTQTPMSNAAAPTAEKEAAPAARTATQVQASDAAAPTAVKEPAPGAPTGTQVQASNAAAATAEKEPAPGAPTVTQTPTSDAAAPTAEKEPAPAPAAPTVTQSPTSNAAAPTAEKETATKPDEAASGANAKATAELASLKPGFSPKDLVAALNDSVINFGSDSAELPASTGSFLQNAAVDLKQMPAGYKLEIAGYTDNTGRAAVNVALSQRRADAVREALVKSGADADMLVAKGYGSADPIASNDTPDGRLRNRRIEYRFLRTPDTH